MSNASADVLSLVLPLRCLELLELAVLRVAHRAWLMNCTATFRNIPRSGFGMRVVALIFGFALVLRSI
jgi:hypothetical protein